MVIKLLPFWKRFNKAAKKHDLGYGIGGNLKDKTREDTEFFKTNFTSSKYNPLAHLFNLLYTLAVFLLGTFFFNWRHNNA